MGRIKLDMPADYSFSTDLTVRITDINYGGHLGNAAVLELLHEARVRFLRANGYSELDAAGYGLIMLDSVIIYKAQAFAGDILKIEVTAGEFSRLGFDLLYRITLQQTGAEVALAKTGLASFDYAAQKRVSPPELLIQKLSGKI